MFELLGIQQIFAETLAQIHVHLTKRTFALDEVVEMLVHESPFLIFRAAHLFEIAPDQGYCLRIRTQKTQTEATLPISNEAYELCGTPSTGKVFKGLQRSMTQHPIKKWIKQAEIQKHISFHCFRHSYAVIQISLGTDIYTVSKMLTHKNVSTTQIYADLINTKKRETANKISLK